MPSRYSKKIIQQEDGSIKLQFETKSQRDRYFNLCKNKPHKGQFNKLGKQQRITITCLGGINSGIAELKNGQINELKNPRALKTTNQEMELKKK